jgi:hypothetical protein
MLDIRRIREEYATRPESTTPCCSVAVRVEATLEKRCPRCRRLWRVEVTPLAGMHRLDWLLLTQRHAMKAAA